jgi:leucyl-tRNA synthetase
MHKCILEVSERIDSMKFNTAVSSLMIYVNYLAGKLAIAPELYENLVLLLSPFAPHLAEELWECLGKPGLASLAKWPEGDARLAEDATVTVAVQVNGKMRATLELPKGAPREAAEAAALELEIVKKYLDGNPPKKLIVVPDKIVNVIV